MNKVEHHKIFVNGVGHDATGYGITPHFFSLEKPNGETIFFPWTSVQHIRLVKEWAELAKKHQEEEQRRQNPKVDIPGPGAPVIPFDPNAPKN